MVAMATTKYNTQRLIDAMIHLPNLMPHTDPFQFNDAI